MLLAGSPAKPSLMGATADSLNSAADPDRAVARTSSHSTLAIMLWQALPGVRENRQALAGTA
jgi:hypothetical protein